MTDNFCARHTTLLEDAIDLRGLGDLTDGFDALGHARKAIVTHATNFAGRAAVRMLATKACPLCFANKNPAGVNLDDWVEHAAEEAVTAHVAFREQAPASPASRLVLVH